MNVTRKINAISHFFRFVLRMSLWNSITFFIFFSDPVFAFNYFVVTTNTIDGVDCIRLQVDLLEKHKFDKPR